MATKLQRAIAAMNSFISKASKRNEPLEAYRGTASFKQFETALKKGIKEQASWAAKNLGSVDFDLTDENLTDSEFAAKLGAWLNANMPIAKEVIPQTKVYTALHNAFIFSIQAQYLRLGFTVKAAGTVDFTLTNEYYLATLKNQANYLLQLSNIDETTRQRLISIVSENRLERGTIDEVASIITDAFEDISDHRAFLIANTEANRAMSTAQMAFMRENNVPTKRWIAAGGNTCPVCQGNADDGEIGREEAHSSGDTEPPAHPGCECYEEAGEIDLETIPLWDGA